MSMSPTLIVHGITKITAERHRHQSNWLTLIASNEEGEEVEVTFFIAGNLSNEDFPNIEILLDDVEDSNETPTKI